MSAEINRSEATMRESTAQESSKYLGAMLPEEQRLVLVPIDPQDSWAAFKRLRTWMKESKGTKADLDVSVFETSASLEHTAKIIPLEQKRRSS